MPPAPRRIVALAQSSCTTPATRTSSRLWFAIWRTPARSRPTRATTSSSTMSRRTTRPTTGTTSDSGSCGRQRRRRIAQPRGSGLLPLQCCFSPSSSLLLRSRLCLSRRYFLRARVSRQYASNITKVMDLAVQNLQVEPEVNNSIKMEVGIEDWSVHASRIDGEGSRGDATRNGRNSAVRVLRTHMFAVSALRFAVRPSALQSPHRVRIQQV